MMPQQSSKACTEHGAQPLISVIIPVYNQEEYLSTAIESVLAQTHRNLEVILVDDGSTDGSGRICDDYAARDPRVRVIHQQNGGLSAARNAGLDIAGGEWLAFIDADDAVGPRYLSSLLEAACACGTSIAIARLIRFAGNVPPLLDDAGGPHVVRGRDLLFHMYDSPEWLYDTACSKLFRRELFATLRFPVGMTREDAAIAHELLYPQERVAICPSVDYGYRRNPNSIMSRPICAESFDILDAFARRAEYAERMGDDELAKDAEALVSYWRAMLVAQAIVAGRENVIPERWRMPMGELLDSLVKQPDNLQAKRLLAQLLQVIRGGAR